MDIRKSSSWQDKRRKELMDIAAKELSARHIMRTFHESNIAKDKVFENSRVGTFGITIAFATFGITCSGLTLM
jgi:hypothetical protein